MSSISEKTTIHATLCRETALAFRRLHQKKLCGTRIFLLRDDAGVSYLYTVANEPAPDKEVVSFRISRALKRRLEKLATARKVTLTELVESLMTTATTNVILTADDYREIAEATDRAQTKRKIDRRRKRPAVQGA